MKAYEKFETLRSKDAFLSFLFSISVRVLANTNRKKEETTKLNQEAFIVSDESSEADKNADVFILYKAMSYLSEEQRESIILFEITGFNIKEIAEIQKTSESKVKQRLRRGRLMTWRKREKRGRLKRSPKTKTVREKRIIRFKFSRLFLKQMAF
ncbi:MAG: RNA polymerase sigma-70 factor (ECF subfamily) [Arenicella sp.]